MYTTQRIEKKATYNLLPILTDVDGVLLKWEPAFSSWMASKGYTVKTPNVYKQSTRYGLEQDLADDLVERFNERATCRRRSGVEAVDERATPHRDRQGHSPIYIRYRYQ